MHTLKTSRYALALMLTLGLGAVARAQTAAPENIQADQTVVTMDPFMVDTTKDNGYVATDSLAGGRQNSPIRATPAPMSTITGQFIDDLQLTNVLDILKWSLDTVPTSDRNGLTGGSGGGVFNYWSISSRGGATVQGGNPPTKNYFPMFYVEDTYNIDRIEFDQGPNSLLFGIGDIGGSVNAYTKTARFDKNFENLAAEYTSYGGYRVTLDSNYASGNLALRVNAVAANEKGWRDGDYDHKFGATLAGTWKLNNDKTLVRFEIEAWDQKKAIFGATYQDDVSLWDGKTVSPTWGATIANLGANPQTTPGAPGVTGMSDWGLSPNYNVLVPGMGIMNWAGGVRSMGTNNIAWGAYLRPYAFTYSPTGGTLIPALPSKEFTVAPTDGYLKPQALNMTLVFDQKVSNNMDLELAAYRYVDHQYAINFEGATEESIDLNQQLPNGSTNPNFEKPYSDYFLDKQTQNHWVNEVRGQFTYHFDTTVWGVPLKEVLSASAGEQVTEYDARQQNADWQALPQSNWTANNWTENMVWARIYWNNPQPTLNVPGNVVYTDMPFNWYDFNSQQTVQYGALYSQTRLWDDRLDITLGTRRDVFNLFKVGLRGPSNPPVLSNGSDNTYSVGAIGYVTDWIGLFANQSTNYTPAAGGNAPKLDGSVIPGSEGKGTNGGVRISTKDRKYYASVTWYKDTASTVIGGDSPDFQGLWNDYLAAGGSARDIGPAGQINGVTAQMQYNTTYDVKYTGVEFEVVANPTDNIRVQLHYSAPKGERTNDGVDGLAYFNEHLSEWSSVAAGSSTPDQKLASDLAMAKANYAIWAVPTLAAGVVKSMWNAFATYSFTDTMLKGAEVGFGATETGARQIDQVNKTDEYTTESLLLGYSNKTVIAGHKLNYRVQFNVDNLFNNNKLIFQSYNGTQGMDYNFIPDRKFTVSVALGF